MKVQGIYLYEKVDDSGQGVKEAVAFDALFSLFTAHRIKRDATKRNYPYLLLRKFPLLFKHFIGLVVTFQTGPGFTVPLEPFRVECEAATDHTVQAVFT